MAKQIKILVLKKLYTPYWLLSIFVLVLLLRIPSFFEPFSYGDEMIYLTLGNGVRKGLTLYKAIHDNKPPLLYLIAAISENLFWFKAILAFWSLGTIFSFWKLTQIVFSKKINLQKIAVFTFAILTTLPLLEGNIANAELFLIGPIIAGFFLLMRYDSLISAFIAGLFFSMAALFKIPGIFDLPAIFLFMLFYMHYSKRSIRDFIKRTSVVFVGFLLPILFFFVWYYFRGALLDYLHAAFLQNVGYLSSWRPDDSTKPFYIKNGPLLVRALIVFISTIILFILRKRLSRVFVFSCLWLFFSLFAVTLSERPYPHYLIQSIAPFSILIALLFAYDRIEQTLSLIPIFFFFFVPVYYKFYHYDTFTYYQRFLTFASGIDSTKQYFDNFDGNVNRNYEISRYIVESSDKESSLFVWGDSPPIYALTRKLPPIKYVANYHISDFSNKEAVVMALRNNPPNYIVILPEGGGFESLNSFVATNYAQIYSNYDSTIWKHIR